MFILIFSLCLLMIGYQMYLIKKYKNLNKDEMSYVATLTHDLKSPASAQINMLNLLLKGHFGQLNPKQYEMLKLTCSSAKYMSNLVGDVLSEYKYGLNSTALHKSEFDLTDLINSVIKQNGVLLSDKKLNVMFYHDSHCNVFADRVQIERVIINLLSNAITYGFEKTDININLVCTGKNVDFSVSNVSHFIPPKELKSIFNKFSKSVNSKLNSKSTGLGLYTSKRIISMHGGDVYALSNPDGVCTFGFRLGNARCESELVGN